MTRKKRKIEEMSVQELGKLFPIVIVPYDPNWVGLFRSESELIKNTLGDQIALRIEHFGSTAIEGLSAKPTIDILVEIPVLTARLKENIIQRMAEIGYTFIWRTDDNVPYMHFVKGYTSKGFSNEVFHVHIGDNTHALWDRIYFRDYLRKNPAIAKEYELLKKSLAVTFKFDIEAYTNAKADFVKKITEMAKKESGA